MRIGFDISPIAPGRTGIGQFCYYLLKGLMDLESGDEFFGFSSGRSRPDLSDLRPHVSGYHMPVPTRVLYRVWSAVGRPRVDRWLGGVDVYHATNFFLPPTASAPRVLSLYDLSFLVRPALCSPKIVGPFSRGVPRFAQAADAIAACSEATKRDIVERLGIAPDKVTVTYGAVADGFGPLDPEQVRGAVTARYGLEAPFLLFVGTLEPRKNVVGLLKAFAAVSHRIPHTLALVGPSGWGTGPIMKALRPLEAQGRVVRIGYLRGHEELAWLYAAARAFVFPSFYEGFGLPVLEALTCGCPVVTSKVSSLPEVAGDAAVYVDPEDVDSIADGILRIAEDDGLRQSLSERGLAQARQFSWRRCAETTMGIYRRVARC